MQVGTAVVFSLLGLGGGFLISHNTQEPIVKREEVIVHAPAKVVTKTETKFKPVVPEDCLAIVKYNKIILGDVDTMLSGAGLVENRVQRFVTTHILDRDYTALSEDVGYLSDQTDRLSGATQNLYDYLDSLQGAQTHCQEAIDEIEEQQ
jgi:hypothetical protein